MRVVAALLLLSGLAHAAPEDKTDAELLQDAETICRYEATKRGELDADDFSYCMRNNKSWLAKVAELDAEHQGDFYTKFARPYCFDKGTRRGVSDLGSISFCLGNEVEAFRDIVYYGKQFGTDRVSPIVEEAMAAYGSWNMARFWVRNELDPRP